MNDLNEQLYSCALTKEYYSLSRDRINAYLELLENGKGLLLDVGSGDGVIARKIQDSTGFRVVAVDSVRKNVSAARKKGITAKQADLNKGLPFNENSFDCVLAGEILEHLFDPESLLAEFKRVLKPGGKVIVSVPNIAAWYNRFLLFNGRLPLWVDSGSMKNYGTRFNQACGHVKAFTLKALKELIKEKGFEIEAVKGTGLNPSYFAGTRKESLGAGLFYFFDSLLARKPSWASTIIIKAGKKQ